MYIANRISHIDSYFLLRALREVLKKVAFILEYIKSWFRMMKEYSVSPNRRVYVNKQDGELFVTIDEPGSELKSVTLPTKRWAAFIATEPQIEQSLTAIQAQQYVKLNTHTGGGFYVSVTTGYSYVDVRRFYYSLMKRMTLHTIESIALNLN